MSSRSSLPSPSINTHSSSSFHPSSSTPTSKLTRSNSTGLDILASPSKDKANGQSRLSLSYKGGKRRCSPSFVDRLSDHPYGIISTSSALLTRSNSSSSGVHSPQPGKNWTRGHQSSRSLSSINTNELSSSPMPFPPPPSVGSVPSSPSARPSSNLKRAGTLPSFAFPSSRSSDNGNRSPQTRDTDVRSWSHKELVGWMREKLREEGVAPVVGEDIVKWLERAGGKRGGIGMDGREFLKGDTGNWSTASPPPFLPFLLSLSKRLRRSNLKSRILSGNQREISDPHQHAREGSTLFEEDELSSEDETSSRRVKGLVRGWEERSSASETGSDDEGSLASAGGGGKRRSLSNLSGPRGSLPGLVRQRADSMNDLVVGSPSSSYASLPATQPAPSFATRALPRRESFVSSPSAFPAADVKVKLSPSSAPLLESLDLHPSTSAICSSNQILQEVSPPPPPYGFPTTEPSFDTKPLPTPSSPAAGLTTTYSEDEESPHLANMSHLVRTGSNPYGALRRGPSGPNKPKNSRCDEDASLPPSAKKFTSEGRADEGDEDEEMFEGRRWNEGGGTMRRVTAKPLKAAVAAIVVGEPSPTGTPVPPKLELVDVVVTSDGEEDATSSLVLRKMLNSMAERITALEGRLEHYEELFAGLANANANATSALTATETVNPLALVPSDARLIPSPTPDRPKDLSYVFLASLGVGIVLLEVIWSWRRVVGRGVRA